MMTKAWFFVKLVVDYAGIMARAQDFDKTHMLESHTTRVTPSSLAICVNDARIGA